MDFLTLTQVFVFVFVAILTYYLGSVAHSRYKRGVLFQVDESQLVAFVRASVFVALIVLLVFGAFFVEDTAFYTSYQARIAALRQDLAQAQATLHQKQIYKAQLPDLLDSARTRRESLERQVSIEELTASEAVTELEATQRNKEASLRDRYQNRIDSIRNETKRQERLLRIASTHEAKGREAELIAQINEVKDEITNTVAGSKRDSLQDSLNAIEEERKDIYNLVFQDKIRELKIREKNLINEATRMFDVNIEDVRKEKDALIIKAQTKVMELTNEIKAIDEDIAAKQNDNQNIDYELALLNTSIEGTRESIDLIESNLSKGHLGPMLINWHLAVRALCLGGLGALVTLVISYEPQKSRTTQRRIDHLLAVEDFWFLLIEYTLRGAVTAAAGFALFYTNIFSVINIVPEEKTVQVPSYWKITILCILLGAYSEKIYKMVLLRFESLGQRSTGGDGPAERGVNGGRIEAEGDHTERRERAHVGRSGRELTALNIEDL